MGINIGWDPLIPSEVFRRRSYLSWVGGILVPVEILCVWHLILKNECRERFRRDFGDEGVDEITHNYTFLCLEKHGWKTRNLVTDRIVIIKSPRQLLREWRGEGDPVQLRSRRPEQKHPTLFKEPT